MTQQEESTVPTDTERIDFGPKQCYTSSELKDRGLHPTDDSLPNENAHSNINHNLLLPVGDNKMKDKDGSFAPSLECRSMHQAGEDSLSVRSGRSLDSYRCNSYDRNEQLVFASHVNQPLQNHQSFSIHNSVPRTNPQLSYHSVNQVGTASTSHHSMMYHQTQNNATPEQPVSIGAGQGRVVAPNYSGMLHQHVPETENPLSLRNKHFNEQQNEVNFSLQPMRNEEGQGRVVMPNYSGVLKHNAPETGNPLSLRNRQLNEQQNVVNFNATPQSMKHEEGQGHVVVSNYSGVWKPNVPETENPLSLRNRQLNEQQNEVNFNATPQSMTNEEGQGRVVMSNYSGVLKPNVSEIENPLSLRNKQLGNQDTVNFSVTSQPNSLDTTNQRAQTVGQPITQHGNRLVMTHHSGEVLPPNKERVWSSENRRLNEQHISLNRSVGAPHSSQMPSDLHNSQFTTPNQYDNQGSTHRHPYDAVPVLDQKRAAIGPHGFVKDTNQQQRPSADILTFRQGNNYKSIQARDNLVDPNSKQVINPSRQQQPEHFDNPPGQRQVNQPMVVNNNQYHEGQISDGGQPRQGKKVFILHYDDVPPDIDNTNSVLRLAYVLCNMKVDVTVDLFLRDNPPNSWPLWYEQNIKDSDVVLCMITENFYHNLTTGNHTTGYSVYNLMNLSTIAVRAVFLNTKKVLDHIPPSMRGATCYCLNSNQLSIDHEEFASLYAFLTGQNRIEKPKLGKMVTLSPRRSRCELWYTLLLTERIPFNRNNILSGEIHYN